ncbi:MAG: hypothetical protein K2N91_05840 [Muribaculaceae bacterium]|nr:hypothetical protein [Muribaculaceae bacterium]
MKFRISALLIAIVCVVSPNIHADSTDNITISAYVPQEANLSDKEAEAVTTMLNRLMTTYGCAGGGFDNRFIVVPNIRDARSEVVGLDSKAVVELDVDLLIGDGVNGTLFSSTSFTVKGIGKNMEQARIAALRKAPARSREMQDFVNIGKQRIVNYYEQQGTAIINTAKSLAQSHEYDNAISTLFAIPSTCSHYAEAQKLAGEYGLKYINSQNDNAIRAAEQAWNANPTEQGAAAAIEALSSVSNPTPAQKAEMDKLMKNMDAKFSLRETREYQARLYEENNRHSERMSEISADASVEKARYDAAASVAKAYVASRPSVVYHVHSWY